MRDVLESEKAAGGDGVRGWRCATVAPMIAVAALPLAGCISLKAPEKPIEINLNVNVKQEVVVRLQKDASDFITKNPELFPQ